MIFGEKSRPASQHADLTLCKGTKNAGGRTELKKQKKRLSTHKEYKYPNLSQQRDSHICNQLHVLVTGLMLMNSCIVL